MVTLYHLYWSILQCFVSFLPTVSLKLKPAHISSSLFHCSVYLFLIFNITVLFISLVLDTGRSYSIPICMQYVHSLSMWNTLIYLLVLTVFSTIACTDGLIHAKAFRSVINCTCKSNFWLQAFIAKLPTFYQDMYLLSCYY